MKTLLTLLLLTYSVTAVNGQSSCCKMSATQSFASIGQSEMFAMVHLPPAPLNFEASTGKNFTFSTKGKEAHGFIVNSEMKSNKWLLVLHEWWGLNDYIRRESERLAKELGDVNVLAIDLYDNQVANAPERAQELMGQLKEERAREIIQGAISYTGVDSKIATIGWCMGGSWSLQTALMAGKNDVACVMYYGMPEKEVEKLKTLNGDVLAIFASEDKWITPEVANDFSKNMKAAGKNVTVKSFKADHAFANPSNPKYDVKAAEEAHSIAVTFLREKLQ